MCIRDSHKIDAEGATAFSNLDMALRSVCPPGLQPQGLVTTTPKPVKLIRDLLAERYGATEITRGRLFDNAVNLAPAFIDAIMRTYDGTRLGQQEVEGLLLDDVEGALWRAITLHTYRVTAEEVPVLGATVVAVDPPAEVGRDACGIITAAVSDMPVNDDGLHGYVLSDSTVEAATPEQWAQVVVNEFYRSKAREVVAEVNQGGDMVRATIHAVDPNVPVRKVRAKDGKRVRAEPVATQYERGRWHHVGEFPLLEEQLTTWTGDSREKSPDRLDALVWAATVLMPPAPVAAISLPGQSVRAGRGVF
jgi:phage terminase large subunit-like protein